MSKSAIILGATGLTGSLLLEQLIADESFSRIILFSRSTAKVNHPKVEEYIIDLFELEQHKEQFNADVVFCCIGTTKKKTPDQSLYRKIDFGIPVTAAQMCRDKGIETFLVISAMGANKNSSIFYNRTKGEMEEEVLAQQITNTYILRPALITGDRSEKRAGEKFAIYLFKVLDWFMIGPLKKYQSISAKQIATAMLNLSKSTYNQSVIDSATIKKLAKGEQA